MRAHSTAETERPTVFATAAKPVSYELLKSKPDEGRFDGPESSDRLQLRKASTSAENSPWC